MRISKLSGVLVIFFCFSVFFGVSNIHAAPDSFKLCPQNCEAVLHLDIKALKGFIEKNNLTAQFKDQIEKIKNLSSVDIFKDINSFTAVLADIASYKTGKNPQGAFLFEGYFRSGEIEKKLSEAGLKIETIETIKMFKLDEDVYLAMPSDKFLIYGNLSEIKAIGALIASKDKNNIEKDAFFNKEINMADLNGKYFTLTVKLPKVLSDLATSIAKINKEQAVFSNLEGFVAAASANDLLFKYIYQDKEAAGRGALSAKEFMEKGFSQIAYNAKKITDSGIDKAKVAVERFNFVKSGLLLMLKLKETMAIEQKDKSVYINFNLTKAEKETGDFVNSLFAAFISLLVKEETKTTAAPASGN